jgi:hypothetical protein
MWIKNLRSLAMKEEHRVMASEMKVLRKYYNLRTVKQPKKGRGIKQMRIFSFYSTSEIIKAIYFARIWWKIVNISRKFKI